MTGNGLPGALPVPSAPPYTRPVTPDPARPARPLSPDAAAISSDCAGVGGIVPTASHAAVYRSAAAADTARADRTDATIPRSRTLSARIASVSPRSVSRSISAKVAARRAASRSVAQGIRRGAVLGGLERDDLAPVVRVLHALSEVGHCLP